MTKKEKQRFIKLRNLRGKWSTSTLKRKLREVRYKPREEAKDVLSFYFVYGYNQTEIIKLKGMTKQAVSNCLHRFLARFD